MGKRKQRPISINCEIPFPVTLRQLKFSSPSPFKMGASLACGGKRHPISQPRTVWYIESRLHDPETTFEKLRKTLVRRQTTIEWPKYLLPTPVSHSKPKGNR